MVKIFYDLETTGTNPRKHGIHQLSGVIEVDGGIIEVEFNFKVQPNPKAEITPEAMAVCGIDELDLLSYPPMKEVFKQFTDLLGKYVDRYDRTDKAFLIGFNNRAFDDIFLRAWFGQNGNSFFGAYFWSDSIDVLVLASEHLQDVRHTMPSFKLARVAKTVGLTVDKERLHDAMYDVELTRNIYKIITG